MPGDAPHEYLLNMTALDRAWKAAAWRRGQVNPSPLRRHGSRASHFRRRPASEIHFARVAGSNNGDLFVPI